MTTTSEKQTTIRLGNRETTWSDLLRDAVSTPGKLLEAYTAFHNYSVGNSLLALFQCYDRGITPGPLNTYKGWQQLGRQVRKGEKAIVLCMPLAYKKRVSKEIQDPEESGTSQPAQMRKTFAMKSPATVLRCAHTGLSTPRLMARQHSRQRFPASIWRPRYVSCVSSKLISSPRMEMRRDTRSSAALQSMLWLNSRTRQRSMNSPTSCSGIRKKASSLTPISRPETSARSRPSPLR